MEINESCVPGDLISYAWLLNHLIIPIPGSSPDPITQVNIKIVFLHFHQVAEQRTVSLQFENVHKSYTESEDELTKLKP